MKKLILITLAAVGLSAGYSQAQQTPQQNFASTVLQYFTSFNTNLTTFQTAKVEIFTGLLYQDGVNLADAFSVDINLKKGGGLYLESETRNAGVAGTIVSQSVGAGYGYVKWDTKFSGGANAGYDFNVSKPLLCVYADVRKALTDNTYSGMRIAFQTDFSKKSPGAPLVELFAGIKF